MTVEIHEIVEALAFVGALMGVYVKLSNQLVKVESINQRLSREIEEEKRLRETQHEKTLAELKEDRKAFKDHQEKTSIALHELSEAIHGLTVFLKGQIPNGKRKKKYELSD